LVTDICDSELDVLRQHPLKILTLSIHQIVDSEKVEAASRHLPNYSEPINPAPPVTWIRCFDN
jgi:hypothetical protein